MKSFTQWFKRKRGKKEVNLQDKSAESRMNFIGGKKLITKVFGKKVKNNTIIMTIGKVKSPFPEAEAFICFSFCIFLFI